TLAELAMGKRESNHVFFAKDGYLIERHDASELASSYYEKNCSYLSQFIAAQTEKLGMGRVQVLLAPAASQVLTEKLPAYAPGWASRELSDHLRPLLPEGTLVDVQPVLAEAQDPILLSHGSSLDDPGRLLRVPRLDECPGGDALAVG
ncbi:MAG: hypothetical protein ACLTXL_16765, partial [Clostridia bacterium]